jgi:magnesium transporter
MKALTTISTVILPMSLLAGIFGMNYRLFPLEARGHESFLVALGLIGLSGMASYLFFRWKKWI